MSLYNITFTDPLINGFTIQPGGFDGPGGSFAHTTLRLYGRGALEWGESVDENLLRLAESFAGSTAPHNPISGQLWFETIFYWHDTSVAGQPATGWYIFNPNTKTWGAIGGSGTVTSGLDAAKPASPTIGQYYYATDTQILYRWDQAYAQEGATWLTRVYTTSTTTPGTTTPVQTLKVYDAYGNGGLGQWIIPTPTQASATAPVSPQQGLMWYDTTTGHLSVWTGVAWQNVLGPSSGTSATIASANIDANAFNIINLPTHATQTTAAPTGPGGNNAMNQSYVDTQDANWGGYTAIHYLNKTQSTPLQTVAGPIEFQNTVQVDGALTLQSATTASGGFSTSSIYTIGQYDFPYGSGSTFYNAGWRNDGTDLYLLMSNVQTTLAAARTAIWNTLRPISVHLATGVVTIDGTGVGTVFGGPITSALTISGALTLSGGTTLQSDINANSHHINNLAVPSTGTDAANANYVNTQIAANNAALGLSPGASVPAVTTSGTAPGSPKSGDIWINATVNPPVISMYAGSAWRQLFPAVYS